MLRVFALAAIAVQLGVKGGAVGQLAVGVASW